MKNGMKKNTSQTNNTEGSNMDLPTAADRGNLERVRLLLEQGADKDKGNSDGRPPLYQASRFGHLDVEQYLNGHLEVAGYLLEQGADRDKADNNGCTPLQYAADQGHLEIAVLLMSYGADLHARNCRGHLPIDFADSEEMKQAIRDEPRRRMDHGHKRATEQDWHPNAAATSASAQQEEVEEEEQSNKRPRLDEEGAVVAEEEDTKVAEEDEDSEPSSDEEDDD
jgi:hypothetical protein